MGTFQDIRTRFAMILEYGINEEVERDDMEGLIKYLSDLETQPHQNTVFKVAGKIIPRPEIEKMLKQHGVANSDADASKLKTLDRVSYVIKSQISNIKDKDQRKNAEQVLDTVDKINDPNVSMEDKVDLLDKLNDGGLIKKNADGTKIYIDSGLTGLDRKVLVSSSNKNPSTLQKVFDEYGKDNVDLEKINRIGKKKMTASNTFGDKKQILKVGVTDKGIDFDGVKYEKVEIPSDEKLLSIYGTPEKVDLAKKYLAKQNKIIELAQESFTENPDMEVLQAVPNTPPTNEENRKKLRDVTGDLITDNLKKQFGDKKLNPEQEQFFKDFEELKNIKDPKEYDDKIMKATEAMFKDPYLDTGSADVVEMVSYMRELNKGNAAYLPARSNYPLGDIITISPEKINFDSDSPKEIERKMQLIMTSVEARSIKKEAGGASSSGEKTELSEYKSIKDSKGNVIEPDVIKGDLQKLSNSKELYASIFDKDSKEAHSEITKLSEKYSVDLKDSKYIERRDKSIQTVIDRIVKRNPDVDVEDLRKKHEAYYDMGTVYENVYNNTVKEQLFTNEKWKYTKTNGLEVDRTDGITSLAKLKFAYDIGWGKDGRPANTTPTRFVNTKVE